MRNTAEKKMDSLMKYVPFIDFVLKIDPQKYVKFSNIRKWILLKKKNYPLSDLNKIEQSIITQYKNLLLEKKVQIPQNITNIFAPLVSNQFVNLCSDDEEEEAENVKNYSKGSDEKSRHANTNQKYSDPNIVSDGEDCDLEFISVDYVDKTPANTDKGPVNTTSNSKVVAEKEMTIDEMSQVILSKIDQITADDIKMKNIVHEPINYSYKKEIEYLDITKAEGAIYERRSSGTDVLFKRRADFQDEVIVENLANKNDLVNKSIEVISLDSGTDGESSAENEQPSTSKVVKSNKTRTIEQIIESTDSNSNSNSSSSTNKMNRSVELLCNSIVSDLPLYDLLDESADKNDATTSLRDEQQMSEGGSNKENSVDQVGENKLNTKSTPDLTPEQISKLLEDISSKTDWEWDTFYEALVHVCGPNSGQIAPCETPPPAPPPIVNNIPTTPVQPNYIPQQQEQLASTLTPNYQQNSNFVPTAGMKPNMPKLNFNDPRIKKQLQTLQNSPLFQYNILNIESLFQSHTQPQTSFSNVGNPSKNNVVTCSKTPRYRTKSSISYGEYKRRQQAKMLEMEKQREEERKAKAKLEMEREREKVELPKNSEESIRLKLLSTLDPCKEQLTTLWAKQKRSLGNCDATTKTNSDMEKEQEKDKSIQITTISSDEIDTVQPNNRKKEKKKETKRSSESQKEANSFPHKNKNSDLKLHRVINELKCSFKGFDNIQDYIVDECLENSSENTQAGEAKKVQVMSKSVGLKRRSSLHALSAISEQLGQQSSDSSDTAFCRPYKSKRRVINYSSDDLSEDCLQYEGKRRKTIDEPIRPTVISKSLRIADDESTWSADEQDVNQITIKNDDNLITKKAFVKLYRISDEFIRKHTKRLTDGKCEPSIVNAESVILKKTCEKIKSHKEPAQKMPKLRKYNNDCQMTERNTVFCVLCRSKPSDLTNHYKGRHKTESYVARLDWSEIEDLATNTPFAKLLPKNKNFRFDRYEVECPFCKQKLCDQFINLYNHYSAHTGEYAYECSHCHLSKPYRPDIQSHILHSKACRNSSIQVMYRYPPQTQCIYLHYCNICNFVQLNEANVLKHLREHHGQSKAISSNVQKCILTAISDSPEENQTHNSPSPSPALTPSPLLGTVQEKTAAEITTAVPAKVNQVEMLIPVNEIKFKVDDDDIPVSNEPWLEDEYLEEEKTSLEDEPPVTNSSNTPMTVIHCINNMASPLIGAGTLNLDSKEPPRHIPIQIKIEPTDAKETIAMPPVGSSNRKVSEQPQHKHSALRRYSVYEKYRTYPLNVSYLGLYKCMIDDCYYSTDCSEEIVKHLTEHNTDELKPNDYFQCPYCVIALDIPITPEQLVEHVRTQHGRWNFQCSMCCYRSANAFNVHVHQKMHHTSDVNSCKIYKCCSDVSKVSTSDSDSNPKPAFEKQLIFKMACRICNADFYYSQFLMHHLRVVHNINNSLDLQIYSCIYCPLMVENKNQIKIHIASKHPGEEMLAYDHNKQINYNAEDIVCNSNVVDISEEVAWTEVTSNVGVGANENVLQDLKPDMQELLRINEETARVRLKRLTAHTGVSPDCLYRCPEQKCGGFFSNFELWLRHIKMRHQKFESICPHCSTERLIPLEQFALHFQQHYRHTFICFYCSTTSPSEILARQHAVEKHNDLGPMRFEKIQFNISYSYSIMISKDLFEEREKFIAELLSILEIRMKELENIEMKKLKKQWPVRENTAWIDDYLQNFSKRKVALRCLVKDCNFRTLGEDILYQHLSTSHTISGTQFNCSKCDYQVEKCHNLDELFNHIKLHNEYIFICAACSLITPSRTRMATHIGEQHSARDVPVIHLFRTSEQMYIKIFIVFSNNFLTFSTMRNCFCCSEQNMSGDVFSLHLKHYHKLSLNYFCEKCINFTFTSLKEVKPHFEQFHNSKTFKISCELACHSDLKVLSLTDFRIQILASNSVTQHVKSEPMEVCDDVVLIEDDDVEIKNSLQEDQLNQTQRPQLRCTSLSKLIEPPSNKLTAPSISTQSPFLHSHLLQNNRNIQLNTTSSVTPTKIVPRNSYNHYNFDPTIMNSSSSLNSIAPSNNLHIVYNNTIISSRIPNTGVPTQTGISPSPVPIQGQVNVNNYMHVPNRLYVSPKNQTQDPFLMAPQNGTAIPTRNYAAPSTHNYAALSMHNYAAPPTHEYAAPPTHNYTAVTTHNYTAVPTQSYNAIANQNYTASISTQYSTNNC